MHPIPSKLRKQLADSGLMNVCVHNNKYCSGRVEWEHCWTYAGRQIQEEWAIVPCCYAHHRGAYLDKDFNRFKSLEKAFYTLHLGLQSILDKYPKKNWAQEWSFLKQKYEK